MTEPETKPEKRESKIPITYGIPRPLFFKLNSDARKKGVTIQTILTLIANDHYERTKST